MTFLETALDLAGLGFHVFPLKPRDKMPIVAGGFKAATRDPEQMALWWKRTPDANIGIACEASGLCVVDCDHGFTCGDDVANWLYRNGLPSTYWVRSGRRPEFGVQLYYRGVIPSTRFELDGVRGDIKSAGGLVVAPPSIHPSGEAYEVMCDSAIAPTPDVVKQFKKPAESKADSGGIETESRNQEMCSFIGRIRKQVSISELECFNLCLCRNETYAKGPLPEDEVKEIVSKQYRLYPDVGPDPIVTIGGNKPEEKQFTDWRDAFHTKDETINAPPISFLIEGFLQREGVTGLAAPVRERKSLIALNVAHALVTGEQLFDHFNVVKMPERVLYLCPEMALGPFSDRLKKIGLLDHVGERLFYRTLSKEGKLSLMDDVLRPALPGSVVILDTAVRFLDGDEDSSTDMRLFADELFSLLRAGAESVLVLYHSPKSQGNADMMTLENVLRGSGDLGAALVACWGTRLQDIAKPYQSASYLENLKQRDFQSVPFEVTSGEDCRLHIVGDPATRNVTLQTRRGNKGNKDGKDDAAEAVIRASPDLSYRELEERLMTMGIARKKTWIGKCRARINGTGVVSGEVA